MPLVLLVVISASVGNFILGLFTYYKNPKSATNTLFFLFTLSLTTYIIINSFTTGRVVPDVTFFWLKMVMTTALIINLLFLLLVKAFPGKKLEFDKFTIGSLIFTAILLPLSMMNLIFKSMDLATGQPVPGPALPLFLLHTAFFLIGGFVIMIKKYLKAIGVEKIQMRYFLLGTIFMFVSIMVTNVFLVLIFKISTFVGLLPVYTLIFVASISYAIVRHRFLDIRAIVARTVGYTLFLAVIGGFYSLTFFFVGSALLNIPFSIAQMVFYGVLAFIVAFSFQGIRRVVGKITDAVFFRGFYRPQELLKQLSTIMSTTIVLDSLTSQILDKLLSEMRLTRGAFVILNKSGITIEFVKHKGYRSQPVFSIGDITDLLQRGNISIFEELEEGQTKTIMRSLNISVILPLKVQQAKIGALILGEKASGEVYSQEDVGILEILAPQLSIAVQNSKEYEEIKRFNITLSEEVNEATKDLQVANVKLKQLDKLKDDFVSIASHELRTPMTAIRSYTWMALNRPDVKLTAKMRRYLERTLISTERLINLVNDMLNVSRIESGSIDITPQAFDIVAMAKDVMEEVSPKAKENDLTLHVLQQKMPPVFADPNKVHQILLNLVGNALKFTFPRGSITASFFSDGHSVEVSIKDAGKGIAKEDMVKLFRKFERLDNSFIAMSTSGGTGLGLYISKSLIDLMHGKIWASSEGVGKGSTFSFSLPIATQNLVSEKEKYQLKPSEPKPLEPVAI